MTQSLNTKEQRKQSRIGINAHLYFLYCFVFTKIKRLAVLHLVRNMSYNVLPMLKISFFILTTIIIASCCPFGQPDCNGPLSSIDFTVVNKQTGRCVYGASALAQIKVYTKTTPNDSIFIPLLPSQDTVIRLDLERGNYPENVFIRLDSTTVDKMSLSYHIGDGKSKPCSCTDYTRLTEMRYNNVIVPDADVYSYSLIVIKK